MKPRQLIILAAAAVIVIAGAVFFFLQQSSSTSTATLATPSGQPVVNAPPPSGGELMDPGPLGERTLGDPKAPNVVIEYASLTCSHCRAFNTNVFKPFKEKYIDTGKVFFVFRAFPLNPVDQVAVMQTRCAPAEKFFPLVDLIFEQQPNWAFGDNPQVGLAGLLKQAGIPQDAFDACLKNQGILDGINWVKDRAAQKFGVGATPTFFFNGKRVEGQQTLADIDKILAG